MDIPVLMMNSVDASFDCSFLQAAIEVRFLPKGKESKDFYNVRLILDCDKSQIRFQPFAYQHGVSERQYNYIGNNKAAADQSYAARMVSDIQYYWSKPGKSLLDNLFKELEDGELKSLLSICKEKELFTEDGLNLARLEAGFQGSTVKITEKKTVIELDGKDYSLEKWVCKVSGCAENQLFKLLIPVILHNGKMIEISSHKEYVEWIEKLISGAKEQTGKRKKKSPLRVCHLCGQPSDSVDTATYCSKFSRDTVSKVFVTTPIFYASEFKSQMYPRNFSLCKDCYKRWFIGDRAANQNMKLRVAGETAILLVDGISKRLDREDMSRIHGKVDIAFDDYKYSRWLEELKEDYLEEQDCDLYEFNLIIYDANGQCCKVLRTMEDISNVWFTQVERAFLNQAKQDDTGLLKRFHLGSIYHMIPVQKDKKNVQLNIGRMLDLYAAILKQGKIDAQVLFEYFAESCECGYRQIMSSEVRNYTNLYGIKNYQKKVREGADRSGLEAYLRYMYHSWLALIEILQVLNVLRGEEVQMEEKDKNDVSVNQKGNWFEKQELYLAKHEFSDCAKGLFYMGAMMYQIGTMQYLQGHKNKPILDKVTYSGMSRREILELMNELYDKIRQYRGAMVRQNREGLIYKAEKCAQMAYGYLGNLPENTADMQDEHQNLFYLLGGYSMCINYEKRNDEEEQNDGEE